MDTAAAQEQLLRCMESIRTLDDSFQLVKTETIVLKRMIYKNNNQHRRAKYFQYLVQVQRLLSRIDWEEYSQMFQQAVDILEKFKLNPGAHHVKWGVLNGIMKTQLHNVLRTIQSNAQHLVEIIQSCMKLYTSFSAQFTMKFFMPLSLSGMSVAARVHTCARLFLVRSIQLHHTLTMVYLRETCKSNPLHASVTANQLAAYQLPSSVFSDFLPIKLQD